MKRSMSLDSGMEIFSDFSSRESIFEKDVSTNSRRTSTIILPSILTVPAYTGSPDAA